MTGSEKVTVISIIEEREEEEDENSSQNGGSDSYCDSDLDPTYSALEDTHVKFSKLSIGKKSKSRIGIDLDLDIGVDKDEEEVVQKIIKAGQLEKLKVEQCKAYLRKNGLRLSGNKSILIQRIKEHLQILNGEREKMYPVSSFVLDCKGDACTGDVVIFEQNVYEMMFNIASRSASGPPCGKRIVAGRIVKESYGEAKQQHTFTIEVLWSKGEKPLPPLHPLLIKGRNLYRVKTLRQRWEDEGNRLKVLMEKHSRGFVARSNRETRILEKEKRKMLKANRTPMNEDPKGYQSQLNLIPAEKVGIQSQRQPALSMDLNKMKNEPQQPSVQPRQLGLSMDSRKPADQPLCSADSRKVTVQPQLSCYSGKLPLRSGEQKLVPNNDCTLVHANDKQPILFNGRQSRINRQPLKRINHHRPMSPPQRQSCMNQQVCRYYTQGRCYFGDNCKFLHEQRDECDQRRHDRWHHGHAHSERRAY